MIDSHLEVKKSNLALKAHCDGVINGFSKLSKNSKINYIANTYLGTSDEAKAILESFWHDDSKVQRTLDEFSENTISNYVLPFGVAPNVRINDRIYCVPMVTEESSVVAAASKAAKFWLNRGGFHAEVVSTNKSGQVHFTLGANSSIALVQEFFNKSKEQLMRSTEAMTANMRSRGGGLTKLHFRDMSEFEVGYFQIWADFETCDAMGANFINSVLETIGEEFCELYKKQYPQSNLNVIMAILSNYTPECLVRAWVECSIEELGEKSLGMSADEFCEKFYQSVRIAQVDKYRATTHNKGIMNGIDSVVMATGNDFRAVEAGAHTHACRDGQYRSLTHCEIKNGKFKFSIEVPLSLGVVGGLTSLHPLAKMSLDILNRPSSSELMMITACIGLAQNFAALKSLVTTGIQKGHMKMHLMNILNHLSANASETNKVKEYFENEVISFNAVRDYLFQLRKYQ